jgi:two-component system sensor histidine kinase KdpD
MGKDRETWPAEHSVVGRWKGYGVAALGVATMTGLIHLVPDATRIANISMLYLLVIIGLAVRFGSSPAVFASVLAFLAFDWFFVEPFYTFTVRDPAEWIALLMFLVTASITGHLTALLQKQADEARRRERETAVLAEASWAVASQVKQDRALDEVLHRIVEVVPVRAGAILTQGSDGEQQVAAQWWAAGRTPPDLRAAVTSPAIRFVLVEGRPVGWERDRRHWDKALEPAASAGAAYLPLTAEDRVLGVLYIEIPQGHSISPAEQRVVESLANHAAVVLERERLGQAESRANALAEADRLKTALLSMVSHDFRSPLASIKASAMVLLGEGSPITPQTQRELLTGIDHEADRLNRMVGNILALSRLEADAWRPQREETDPIEIVGAALEPLSAEQNRRVQVAFETALPVAHLDSVQITQVLHNLIDNALKYSPSDERVEVVLGQQQNLLVVKVLDRGPGLPPGDEERVFDRFYRAPGLRESAVPGVGIGLTVCRGLVEAHGGELTASNRPGGGAMFRLILPIDGPESGQRESRSDESPGHR